MTDDEALARLRAICLRYPEAEEVVSHDERPLFRVRRRRFAIFNGETSAPRRRWEGWPRSLHVLTDPSERDALGADPRFRPSPHHGDRGWRGIVLSDLAWDEVAELIDAAWREAAPKELLP